MSQAPPHPAEGRADWLAIEIRHLRTLAAVADELSFGAAAARLGYVQSAVSQQVAALERIVGQRLVVRSPRPRSVTLTPAGAALLEHADEILHELRRARAEIELVDRRAAPCCFGVATGFGPWLPAALLGALADAGHEAAGVRRATAANLLDAVAAGRLGAAFVDLPISSGPFFAIELLRDPHVLAVPATGRFDGTVDDALARWPLVEVAGDAATRAWQRFAQLHDFEVGDTADSPALALDFVRAGVGATVVAEREVPCDDAIATLPLPALPPRTLGLAWHRQRDGDPAVAALAELARRTIRHRHRRPSGPWHHSPPHSPSQWSTLADPPA